MGRDPFHQTRLLEAPFNLTLNTSREGAATASLGNQGLTTLIVKNFFLRSDPNLPSFSLKPLPLILSLYFLIKSPSPSFSPEPALLCAKQPRLPQPVLTGEVLQPSHNLRGPPPGPAPRGPCLSRAGGSRAGHRTPGLPPERSRGAECPPMPCWPHCL